MEIKEKSTNYQKALKYAFWLFARRNYSVKEIQDKLGRNYENPVIDKVIEKLDSMKLIDDDKFAKEWAEYRFRHNKSKNYVLNELIRKGIKRETIQEIFSSFAIKEPELAYGAIKNKLQRYRKLEQLKAKTKIFQFLANKGFPYDVIDEVWKKYIDNK
ncbi:MAG: regulatory protein RecX [Elusimicrobia bacterium]|nr:regulatory protein RecX [Elusimicrobiota bacterium]